MSSWTKQSASTWALPNFPRGYFEENLVLEGEDRDFAAVFAGLEEVRMGLDYANLKLFRCKSEPKPIFGAADLNAQFYLKELYVREGFPSRDRELIVSLSLAGFRKPGLQNLERSTSDYVHLSDRNEYE